MKQAFVTGASRGIGKEIALALSEEGFEVGFCYSKNSELANELLNELKTRNGGLAFQCDVSDLNSLEKMSNLILNQMPNLSVLVNNAGVSSYGLIQDASEKEYLRVFDTNFKSAFFLTKFLLSPMLSSKFGRIINISSVWGETGASCEVLYASSKAAMIGFTKSLAKELAPSGITVNCITPGVVDTDMMANFSESEKKEIAEGIPLGRFANSREIANVVRFLSSDMSSYITGQVIGVNGGMYC